MHGQAPHDMLLHARTRLVRPKVNIPQDAVVKSDWKGEWGTGQQRYIRRGCVPYHTRRQQQTCDWKHPKTVHNIQTLGCLPSLEASSGCHCDCHGALADPYHQRSRAIAGSYRVAGQRPNGLELKAASCWPNTRPLFLVVPFTFLNLGYPSGLELCEASQVADNPTQRLSSPSTNDCSPRGA